MSDATMSAITNIIPNMSKYSTAPWARSLQLAMARFLTKHIKPARFSAPCDYKQFADKPELVINMAQNKTVEEITDEAIRDGGFLTLIYFDLHSSSEESVKNLMVGFISKLTKEKGVIYAVGEIDSPVEKGGVFSTWAEVKLLAEDFSTLIRISSQYSPIGVEILRPDKANLSLGEAQGILLDVSQMSQNFTRLIMEKVLTGEEREAFTKKIAQREELGRKLMDKK
jgi:hypothetical protein